MTHHPRISGVEWHVLNQHREVRPREDSPASGSSRSYQGEELDSDLLWRTALQVE